jgi:15-cis-phytoene synthase/lycopene beta-cyclase
MLLIRSLLLPTSTIPLEYVDAFRNAVSILQRKSKSFYIASFILPIDIRQDSITLYAFCGATDDLIDEASGIDEASNNLKMMTEWLDLIYSSTENESEKDNLSLTELRRRGPSKTIISFLDPEKTKQIRHFLLNRVPIEARTSFLLLSTVAHRVPRYPFDELLRGYQWDLERSMPTVNNVGEKGMTGKILAETQDELVQYARFVAGSIGEMLVWMYLSNQRDLNIEGSKPSKAFIEKDFEQNRWQILSKANDMGVALQTINIARDIREDAEKLGRVYIPVEWFNQQEPIHLKTLNIDPTRLVAPSPSHLSNLLEALSPESGVDLNHFPYATYTARLLDLAGSYYESIAAIKLLPKSCQRATRAAVEVYREIGSEVFNRDIANFPKGHPLLSDGRRVKVSKWRRIGITLKELCKIN